MVLFRRRQGRCRGRGVRVLCPVMLPHTQLQVSSLNPLLLVLTSVRLQQPSVHGDVGAQVATRAASSAQARCPSSLQRSRLFPPTAPCCVPVSAAQPVDAQEQGPACSARRRAARPRTGTRARSRAPRAARRRARGGVPVRVPPPRACAAGPLRLLRPPWSATRTQTRGSRASPPPRTRVQPPWGPFVLVTTLLLLPLLKKREEEDRGAGVRGRGDGRPTRRGCCGRRTRRRAGRARRGAVRQRRSRRRGRASACRARYPRFPRRCRARGATRGPRPRSWRSRRARRTRRGP